MRKEKQTCALHNVTRRNVIGPGDRIRLWPVSVTDMGYQCQAQQFWCRGGVAILYPAYVTETIRCDVINTGVLSMLYHYYLPGPATV